MVAARCVAMGLLPALAVACRPGLVVLGSLPALPVLACTSAHGCKPCTFPFCNLALPNPLVSPSQPPQAPALPDGLAPAAVAAAPTAGDAVPPTDGSGGGEAGSTAPAAMDQS